MMVRKEHSIRMLFPFILMFIRMLWGCDLCEYGVYVCTWYVYVVCFSVLVHVCVYGV